MKNTLTEQNWIRSTKIAAGTLIGVLISLLVAILITGVTDTRDWVQFAVPCVILCWLGIRAMRFHIIKIPPLLSVDGSLASVLGLFAIVDGIISGCFAVIVIIRK